MQCNLPSTEETPNDKRGAGLVFRVASQPEERIVFSIAKDLADTVRKENITHQALIIAGRVLEVNPNALTAVSKLYDKTFAHGYRAASKTGKK